GVGATPVAAHHVCRGAGARLRAGGAARQRGVGQPVLLYPHLDREREPVLPAALGTGGARAARTDAGEGPLAAGHPGRRPGPRGTPGPARTPPVVARVRRAGARARLGIHGEPVVRDRGGAVPGARAALGALAVHVPAAGELGLAAVQR